MSHEDNMIVQAAREYLGQLQDMHLDQEFTREASYELDLALQQLEKAQNGD